MMDDWTIGRVLTWAASDLSAHGADSARLDAELLLAEVLHCDRVKLIVDSARPLEPHQLAAYKALHKRRRRAEPVAYLRGRREFYSRSFVVDARVLVPRPETELLVEMGLARTAHVSLSARVLDVCTGSGCVAITLAKERPTTRVVGSDICKGALEVARDNCHRLGALVTLVESDVYDSLERLRGSFDLITANPPYIRSADFAELPPDVRDFEPRVALDAGVDGLSVTRRVVEGAPAMLTPGGVLVVEVVAGGAATVAGLFEHAGLEDIVTTRDHGGHDRVVSGRWAAKRSPW